MLESRHSRLPVFRERRDMIVGVVYNKDLLPFLIEGQSDRPVSEAMRPAHFVHEKRLVADLVREFQEHRRVMALVTDEFGGIAGLVTMEDALEELVGEILDEEDLEERSTQPLGDDTYLVRGNTATHDLERDLSISLPEGEYEAVELSSGVRIQVLEADARRVLSVKVILPPSDDGEGDAEAVEDEPH
jgi:CBS domain containing-hemolysin-like protein